MAYTRRNHLLKVLRVQEIFREYTRRGHTPTWIFNNLIKPNYFISRTTYYEYLRTPAARDLRQFDPIEKAANVGQTSLF